MFPVCNLSKRSLPFDIFQTLMPDPEMVFSVRCNVFLDKALCGYQLLNVASKLLKVKREIEDILL